MLGYRFHHKQSIFWMEKNVALGRGASLCLDLDMGCLETEAGSLTSKEQSTVPVLAEEGGTALEGTPHKHWNEIQLCEKVEENCGEIGAGSGCSAFFVRLFKRSMTQAQIVLTSSFSVWPQPNTKCGVGWESVATLGKKVWCVDGTAWGAGADNIGGCVDSGGLE